MGHQYIREVSEMVDLVRHEEAEVQYFVQSGNRFLKIIQSFIAKSVREEKLTQKKGRACFKEVLHKILFCGHINIPVINPEEMLDHREIQLLSEKYPDVFQKYNTHLPKRPPYAVLLDAVVKITGTNINEVLKCLTDLNYQMLVKFTGTSSNKLGNTFPSEVISCCCLWDVTTRGKTDNYFGTLLSLRGRQQKEIMIDILCCQTWHQYISLGVSIYKTFNKTPGSQHDLPSAVQPYSSHESSSYKSCSDMIYINNSPYFEFGICPECECLSQLLYTNQQVVEKLECLDIGILMYFEEVTNSNHERLKQNLKSLGFNVGYHLEFYDPNE
ncbi:uncharacterized protein LOC125463802 isoform X1 [Stegostoma tigrinum]|uniref:uncharacterized protein LOC125463802 isoform X1 n=2 Tax=Stegostoma tigrinum TaxID=3053191 RepID=UPI00287095D4|nr:uncharacterized protein LOC125463802 isoform X1 [Stegostoma tigrinum]